MYRVSYNGQNVRYRGIRYTKPAAFPITDLAAFPITDNNGQNVRFRGIRYTKPGAFPITDLAAFPLTDLAAFPIRTKSDKTSIIGGSGIQNQPHFL